MGSGEERFSFFVVSNRSWGLSRKWGVGSGEWGVGSGEWGVEEAETTVFCVSFFQKTLEDFSELVSVAGR